VAGWNIEDVGLCGYTSELGAAQALGVPVLAKPAAAPTLLRVLGDALRSRAAAGHIYARTP